MASESQKLTQTYSSPKKTDKEDPTSLSARISAAVAVVLGIMGSSEGGRSPAEVSMADRIRRWRATELAGLAVVYTVVTLVEACFSEYEQFVPEVSQISLRLLGGDDGEDNLG